MKQIICLFEDNEYTGLLPLAYTRPVYDLNCGILSLREKVCLRFPKSSVILHSREYLTGIIKERNPDIKVNDLSGDSILFINGRLVIDDSIAKIISKLPEDLILHNESGVIALKLSRKYNAQNLLNADGLIDLNKISSLPRENKNATLIRYSWELVNINGSEIQNDFNLLTKKTKQHKTFNKLTVIKNRKQVFAQRDSMIDPFVVIDASEGPIYIGKKVHIMPHVYIQGPAFIGDYSIIKSHTSIYHNTSIGKVCKVGGEVENSIIHSYTNKQHDGFLGHSYLGSWINLGAGTNNSDLKNNYGIIDLHVNGKSVSSGSQFVGLIMGDHSKTAINTMFNTGTIVGVSCNIFGAGFPPRYIPSYTWGGSEWLRTYNLSKSKEVAAIVMNRRNMRLSESESGLLDHVFELTTSERKS